MPTATANTPGRLSLVIPLGPGRTVRPELLALVKQARAANVQCRLSTTETGQYPGFMDDELVIGSPGRGRQMNRAATRVTDAHWLWFLHADSRPCPQVLPAALALSRISADALCWFRLAYAADGPWLTRLNAAAANLRSRWLGMPYGDQGLILPQTWFERLGGFREDLERGEDLDLVVRAQKSGLGLRQLDGRITTSARRYAEQGWLKTTWHHQIAAWRLVRDARRATACSPEDSSSPP